MEDFLNNPIDFNQIFFNKDPFILNDFWQDIHYIYNNIKEDDLITTISNENQSLNDLKPHKCNYCSRAFARRHDLERHTRVHTGIKPYKCPSCQKSFARSDARRRHFKMDSACCQDFRVQCLIHSKRKTRLNNSKTI